MVCLSVGLCDAIVIPAKTVEPMEMPFGMPRYYVLDGSVDAPTAGALLGECLAHSKA